MSIYGAMTTAISGLSAQSAAFSNIGDNIANTQTIGFKSIGTTFHDYVTTSTLQVNQSGAVVAAPDYNNSVQGTITQSDNPLALAVSGQGFLPVSVPTGTTANGPTFNKDLLYTREGDFKLDANGYLVNATGHYLNGWLPAADGSLDLTKLTPLQVGQSAYAPVPTSGASLVANLPATPSSNNPATTQLPIIDAQGTSHNLNLSWTPKTGSANTWSLAVSQENADGSTSALGSVDVAFGTAGNAAAPQGTIGAVTQTSGSTTGSTYAAGKPALVGITADFGLGAQTINLNLGTFGGTDGVTQFAGTNYNLISVSQNGVQPGSFSSVSMQQNGDVVVNYDNGLARTVARVPVVTFESPDSLQRMDGQAYRVTKQSGNARTNQAGSNGAGNLSVSATEASNVDIAAEFAKLIVAQRAYSANTKMVTTADDLLQQTIDMKR